MVTTESSSSQEKSKCEEKSAANAAEPANKENNEVKNTKMQLPTSSSSAAIASSASVVVVTSPTAQAPSGQGTTNNCGFSRARPNRPSSGKGGPTPSSSSLPPSAVSAAPYIPPAYQQNAEHFMVHQHQHHIAYYESPPPPMGHPPPPWISATPYFFDQSGGAAVPPGGAPPFVHHMCTMPPPHLVPTSGGMKNGGGRATPSPSNVASPPASTGNSVVGNSSEVQHQQYEVEYHLVRQGEVVSLQLGDGRVEIIPGPAHIRMLSPNSSPPVALPMQVPQGHMVQQILDPNGTLQHVILAPDMLSQHQPPPQSHHGVPITPYTSTLASSPGVVVTATGATPFTTPSTNCSGAPPRQPFPSSQYGQPIIPGATTPSSHGPSPTPSSGSGGGSFGSQPPGYPRSKFGRMRGSGRQPMATPPASPAKNSRGKESTSFRSPSSGSGSSGIGSSNSSTSGGPNITSSTSPGNTNANSAVANRGGKTARSHQDDSEESGVGHEEDEEMQQLLVELLSLIRTPKVTEIEGRSALLKWGPPIRDQGDGGAKFESLEHISDAEFRYEVCLSDKGKDGKYRSIFTTSSIECRLTDLRPCTEYHIRIHAMTDNLRGGASDTVSFETQPCEPDKPAPPKLVSRTKTSLSLRWNAPNDNGRHIQHYILESDEGRGQPPTFGSWCGACNTDTTYCSCKANFAIDNFVEVFRGRAKNFNMTKLASSSAYRFRLVAENELGRSRPSEIVAFQTQGTAPPKPQPPGLKEATKSSLHLVWSKRLTDSEFILHMDDQISGHGFLPVYTGSDTNHISTGLRRNAAYKFRLRAQNEEGQSPWCDEVSYFTLPDVPGPPLRPASKGRLHPHSFKVRWDPPSDDGGSPVENYILEIDGGGGWQTVYQGGGLEYLCEFLYPGTQYKVRVACTSKGGVSDYSEVCHICTEPVTPGQCAPPRPHGKPKANSLHLKWGWPEADGGSAVTEFEIDMTSPDNETRAVYKGRDTECVVASLLPGRPYLFQVRAFNRVGPGPWSDSLEIVSGAGAPDVPLPPRVTARSPTVILVEWNEPSFNGAVVNEYRLQLAVVASRKCLSPPTVPLLEAIAASSSSRSSSTSSSIVEEDDDSDEDEEELEDEEPQESPDSENETTTVNKRKVVKRKRKSFRSNDNEVDDNSDSYDEDRPQRPSKVKQSPVKLRDDDLPRLTQEPFVESDDLPKELLFSNVYSGPNRTFEARNLDPATTYQFRVSAVNSAGASDWSELAEVATPPSAPAAVTGLHVKEASAVSMVLAWLRPQSNGEHITHYNVDTGSSVISTQGPETSFLLEPLKPDTIYSIRVQAVNCVGSGPFSSVSRLSTRPLPPAPPRCECVNANHNLLKLKWGDSKSNASTSLSDPCQYTLEMENSRNQFQVVYSGPSLSHKVSKLVENKTYKFRMCASNAAGHGPYSQVYEFKTAYAHPQPVKAAPRVSNITEDGCLVEWSALKHVPGQGDLRYKVSLTKVRDNEAKTIYSGSDTQFRASSLEPKTEYTIRVCGVRVPATGSAELAGPLSPPAVFTTLSNDGHGSNGANLGSSRRTATFSGSGLLPQRDAALSDTQRAFVIVVGFTVFALFVGIVMQQIIEIHGSN